MTRRLMLVLVCLTLLSGCRKSPLLEPDQPQLTPDVQLIEDTIHSRVLGRDMVVRFIVPVSVVPHASLPVVYLLHGAGVTYRDWTNNSRIASFSARGVVLVLPNLPGAYDINQADGMRYEDYFFQELVPETHRVLPSAASDRAHTAIVGISRGGYGAAVLGLKQPQAFAFIGLLSPALDFAERSFRMTAPVQSMQLRRVFGPIGGETRKHNDPYLLVQKFQPGTAPFIFIGGGHREPLGIAAWHFSELLKSRKLSYEWHPAPGGHSWATWNEILPSLETSLQKQFGIHDVVGSERP